MIVITTEIIPSREHEGDDFHKENAPLSLLGSQQVLVFEDGPLQVDDPLGPQGYLQHPPHLDVHFRGAQDHHIVILQKTPEKSYVNPGSRRCGSIKELQLMFGL